MARWMMICTIKIISVEMKCFKKAKPWMPSNMGWWTWPLRITPSQAVPIYYFDRNVCKFYFSSVPPDDQNTNYYQEYCRLFIANVVLTTQMKELVAEKNELMARLSKLEVWLSYKLLDKLTIKSSKNKAKSLWNHQGHLVVIVKWRRRENAGGRVKSIDITLAQLKNARSLMGSLHDFNVFAQLK